MAASNIGDQAQRSFFYKKLTWWMFFKVLIFQGWFILEKV